MPDNIESYGDRIVFLTRMVGTELTRQLEEELRTVGLTRSQLGALSQLGLEHPGALSGAVLSRRAGVTPQSMSTAIASLLERGLVERSPNPDHGRRLDVRATPAGLTLLRDVQVVMRELDERAVRSLGERERTALRSTLRRMMDDLGLYVPDA